MGLALAWLYTQVVYTEVALAWLYAQVVYTGVALAWLYTQVEPWRDHLQRNHTCAVCSRTEMKKAKTVFSSFIKNSNVARIQQFS